MTFAAYLSPYVRPEICWPFSFVGIAYPWLLLLNTLFVFTWLSMRKRYFLFSLACILMGWSHLTGFIGLSIGGSGLEDERTIRVMSYNIQYLDYVHDSNAARHQKKVKAVSDFLNAARPDILCIQESNRYDIQLLVEKMKFSHYHRRDPYGTAILSKYPIGETGVVSFETSNNSCLWADIQIKGKTFRVYSMHLQSNSVSGVADKVITSGDLQEKETWNDIRSVIRRIKKASAKRSEQADQVAEHIRKSPHPVILCGDMNDTPQSFAYRQLSDGLLDAFREKGAGLGTTYAGKIPALRIDYVLVDPSIRVDDYFILKKNYSDHYPVVSKLWIPK
ncbi:MAG: endonuclease/exonuclease/phosphatase family protein [Bacteroidota bacterium]